ncbi:transcriptional regulatory protein [Klebsiella variicola]|uniref:Transcriptional regulatory protein n=1 Tax=Klebsiella variicola TaxID=244366 RepID=A0A7H4MFI8_KLEVA|nr:transcriptional regulatory protein [Klebsiella variicola]
MGGELVFITGINHPRDEANLIQLLMEGKQRGIAGMVILTGEAYIHAIPAHADRPCRRAGHSAD